MTDTQAIDVVTFDFKGTRGRCFVSGSTDYQMNYSYITLVNVKAPVVATTNWWWLISALVVA